MFQVVLLLTGVTCPDVSQGIHNQRLMSPMT